MQRRTAAWMISMVTILAGSALIAAAQSKPKTAGWTPPPFKPVTRVEAMMNGQDVVFDGIKAGVKAGRWDDARHQAWILAELANVNIQQAKAEDYGQFAKDMSDKCVDLARVLRKRN